MFLLVPVRGDCVTKPPYTFLRTTSTFFIYKTATKKEVGKSLATHVEPCVRLERPLTCVNSSVDMFQVVKFYAAAFFTALASSKSVHLLRTHEPFVVACGVLLHVPMVEEKAATRAQAGFLGNTRKKY